MQGRVGKPRLPQKTHPTTQRTVKSSKSSQVKQAMEDDGVAATFQTHTNQLSRHYQALLDRSTPFTLYRWIGFAVVLLLFLTRILVAQGWYIVCYSLGIYLLNLFLAFLQPKFDPSYEQEMREQESEEGGALPTRKDEEFRPFIRRLPEFKFWYSATRATLIGFCCTWFAVFDIPVFWPVLLLYFCILFAITMRKQIQHMIKYKYIPFDLPWRKKQFNR